MMTRGRRGTRTAVFFVLAGAIVLPTQGAEAASSPCASDQSSSHSLGADSFSASGVYGAQATINSKNPDLCGNANLSVVWALITGTGADDGLAQVGNGHFGSNDPYPNQPGGFSVFSQWVACVGCTIHTVVTGNAPSGFNDYLVLYGSETGNIFTWKGNTLVDHTFNFDAQSSWDRPWSPQFVGETKNVNTDLVGTQSDHSNLNTLRKVVSDGSLSVINSLTRDSLASIDRYHEDGSNLPNNIDLWTDPL